MSRAVAMQDCASMVALVDGQCLVLPSMSSFRWRTRRFHSLTLDTPVAPTAVSTASGLRNGWILQPNRSCWDFFLPPKPPPNRRGFHPSNRRSHSSSTSISFPSMLQPCIRSIARRASSREAYSTNAYPRGIPVTMSVTSRDRTIVPKGEKLLINFSCKKTDL